MSASAVRQIHIEYPSAKVDPSGGMLWPSTDSGMHPKTGDRVSRSDKWLPFGREWLHAGPDGGDAA